MGNDHQARKLAKKRRKRDNDTERPGGKRLRVKAAHKKTRKNCRGLCYGTPPSLDVLAEKPKKVFVDTPKSTPEKTARKVQADPPSATPEKEGFPVMAAPKARPFFPSPKWKGPKPGYHFTNGSLGLGYYSDPKEQKKLQKLQKKESKMPTRDQNDAAPESPKSPKAKVDSKKKKNKVQ
eukprot:7777520-Pyramimonas_sp.AAC.1